MGCLPTVREACLQDGVRPDVTQPGQNRPESHITRSPSLHRRCIAALSSSATLSALTRSLYWLCNDLFDIAIFICRVFLCIIVHIQPVLWRIHDLHNPQREMGFGCLLHSLHPLSLLLAISPCSRMAFRCCKNNNSLNSLLASHPVSVSVPTRLPSLPPTEGEGLDMFFDRVVH